MGTLDSYSIDELMAETGFDRRTISYYTTKGLLPRVGRRGPKTRYGQEFVDRLKFIRKVKHLQDAGKLPSVKLEELARIIRRVEAEEGEVEGERTLVTSIRSHRSLQDVFARVLEQLEHEAVNEAVNEAALFHSPALSSLTGEPPADLFMGEAGIGDQMSLDSVSQEVADWDDSPAAGTEMKPPSSMMDRALSKASNLLGIEDEHQVSHSAAPDPKHLTELNEQVAQLRDLSERSVRSDQSILEHLPRLFAMLEEQGDKLGQLTKEVQQLRRQLDDERAEALLQLKKRGVVKPPLYSTRPRPKSDTPLVQRVSKAPGVQHRARMFAMHQGLPLKDLRTARLRDADGENPYWEFRLNHVDLQRETLTLLCEGRGYVSRDPDFMVLEIPSWFLDQPLGPLFKKARGEPLRLSLSASDANLFQLLEVPEILLAEFRAG
jgi:DNA-binding transcriptional MerR regulator